MSETVEPAIDLMPVIRRKLVWDILPCPTQGAELVKYDLIPGSVEGDEVEHRQSHTRLNRLIPIDKTVKLLSAMAGEIVGRCILESQGVDVDDALGEAQIAQFAKVATASTIAVLANLVDQEIISIEGGVIRERLLD